MQNFVFKSAHDHVLCERCLEHQGSSAPIAARRDREHVKLWEAVFAVVTEQHSQRVQQLRAEAAQRDQDMTALRETVSDLRGALQADIEQRPVATVQAWFDSVRVREAEDKREAAYRSRDFAMSHIWSLDRLHHTDDRNEEMCSCGKECKRCREWSILDRMTISLDRWETQQLERLRDDLPHGLPDEHPEVLKSGRRSWRTG
jgi:hypothetical protein